MERTLIIELPWGGKHDPDWQALRSSGPATVQDLWASSRSKPAAIRAKLRRWVRAGFVRTIEGRPERFAMTESARKHPVQPDTIKVLKMQRPRSQPARIWSAIRVLKSFDLPTIQISAEVTAAAAQRYLGLLCRTGYIDVEGEGDDRVFRLARPTGPLAPIFREGFEEGRKYRLLADPNTGELHHLPARRGSDAPFFEGKA